MAIKLPQTNLPSFIMTTTLNITRIPGRCVTDFRESKTSRRLTQLQAVIVDICHTQASKIEFFVASCIGSPPISRFEQRHLWMREDLVYRGYSNKVTWLMHSRRRATRTTIAAGQSPTFYEIQSNLNLKPSTEIFSLLANMHFTANLLREFVVISTVRIYRSGAKIINFSGDEHGLNILESLFLVWVVICVVPP